MPGEKIVSGYPCHVACLLCDPAAVFFTLDQLAEHYVREHPISKLLPRSLRVVQQAVDE